MEARLVDTSSINTINELRKQIWTIEGILRHNFSAQDLVKVLERHCSIGYVPQGYLYPELLHKTKVPLELEAAMQNKKCHM